MDTRKRIEYPNYSSFKEAREELEYKRIGYTSFCDKQKGVFWLEPNYEATR